MKTFGILLLCLALRCGLANAQSVRPTPRQPTLSDSTRRPQPPILPMGTEFYRNAGDPANVVRAELDNMPIKTPDLSQQYKMPNPYNRHPSPPGDQKDLLPKNLQIPSPKRR